MFKNSIKFIRELLCGCSCSRVNENDVVVPSAKILNTEIQKNNPLDEAVKDEVQPCTSSLTADLPSHSTNSVKSEEELKEWYMIYNECSKQEKLKMIKEIDSANLNNVLKWLKSNLKSEQEKTFYQKMLILSASVSQLTICMLAFVGLVSLAFPPLMLAVGMFGCIVCLSVVLFLLRKEKIMLNDIEAISNEISRRNV
jgi:hypothetical protein